MNNVELARDIFDNVGGTRNVIRVTQCTTRLRFRLEDKDDAKTDRLIRTNGILTVISSGSDYQILLEGNADEVFREIKKLQTKEEESKNDDSHWYNRQDDYESFKKEFQNKVSKPNNHLDIEDPGLMPKFNKLVNSLFKKD